MRVKSTSKIEVTCADVCRDTTMCSAISARIFDIGSTTSPGHGSGSGPCRRAAGAAGGARRARGGAFAPDSRKSSEVLLRDAAGDAGSLQAR